MTWQRLLVTVCGIALIVLGFAGYHVEVAAVVIGLIMLGALSGELLTKALRNVRDNAPPLPPPSPPSPLPPPTEGTHHDTPG